MRAILKNLFEKVQNFIGNPIFQLYLFQIIDLGNSTGSLIFEVFHLISTFQKITAPITFSTTFSGESTMTWVIDFINSISRFFSSNPLSPLELYNLYSLAFPLTILMFIQSILAGKHLLQYLLVDLNFFLFGLGWSYLFVLGILPLVLIIASAILFIIFFCLRNRCAAFYGYRIFSTKENANEEMASSDNIQEAARSKFAFSRAIFPALLFLYLFSLPIYFERRKLHAISAVVHVLICAIVLGAEFLINKKFPQYKVKIINKLISVLSVNCFTLLLIPSTKCAISIIIQKYLNVVHAMVTYSINNVIHLIVIVNTLIKSKNPELFNKYKPEQKERKCCKYAGIEVWEILKNLAYACFACAGVAEACLMIVLVWGLIILFKRPYNDASRYILSYGNTTVLFISNFLICYVAITERKTFDLWLTFLIIFITFVFPITAIYVFFLREFKYVDNKSEEQKTEENKQLMYSVDYVAHVARILAPISWFFYGVNVEPICKIVQF